MSLHTYYNPQIIRFVLLYLKIFDHQNSGSDIYVISLSLVEVCITVSTRRFRHLKQFDEPNRYNKYYWPSSKWNQISVKCILKIIYINNRECAHCGHYLHFMDLIGLVSVRTSLNFIETPLKTCHTDYSLHMICLNFEKPHTEKRQESYILCKFKTDQ